MMHRISTTVETSSHFLHPMSIIVYFGHIIQREQCQKAAASSRNVVVKGAFWRLLANACPAVTDENRMVATILPTFLEGK